MCHGHPHYHPCSHTSVKWLYCPEAKYDMETGYEQPCANPIYSAVQSTNVNCPLQNCNFKKLKGSWNCCVCNQGPNAQGWCTVPKSVQDWNPLTRRFEVMEMPCGHGCCSNCTRATSSRESSPEVSHPKGRSKSNRKSHSGSKSNEHKRSSSTYDYNGSYPEAAEDGGQEAAAATATSPRSRGSRTKSSSGKGSSHKGRKHH